MGVKFGVRHENKMLSNNGDFRENRSQRNSGGCVGGRKWNYVYACVV